MHPEDKADTRLRILEIESELAEMKRRYVVDGIAGDFTRRTTLEAELALLLIVRHKERTEEVASKEAAKDAKSKSFLFLLCAKVEDAGLGHLIDEAKRESLDTIKDAGLFEAYSAKGAK